MTKHEAGDVTEPGGPANEILIPQEMIEAGYDELLDWRAAGSCGEYPERECVTAIFRAMLSSAPQGWLESFSVKTEPGA